jgi:thioredoxin-related protein
MYSSFRCSHCARQRALLGDSFQYINEIECHPQGEHSQTELCFEKDVKGTPTFIMEPDGKEIKREVGYMTIEELREFSGCTE